MEGFAGNGCSKVFEDFRGSDKIKTERKKNSFYSAKQTEDQVRTALLGRELFEGVTGELDVERRRARGDTRVLDRLNLRGFELVALRLEVDDGVGDLAVLTDLQRAADEGRHDARDGLHVRDLLVHREDVPLVTRDRAGLGLEDDLVDVAGLALESRFQQLQRVRRVGTGQRERVRVGGAEGLRERVHPEEEDDPEGEDQPATTIRKTGEGLHEGWFS